MYQKLSDAVITETCRELLQVQRRVTVRRVSEELRRRHQASGKNARVARILREQSEHMAATSYEGTPNAEIARLQAVLRETERQRDEAIARAELSEQRERSHQDLWARRFAERMDEYDRRMTVAIKHHEREASVKHLQLRQQIAELERENARLVQKSSGEESPR